jgi:hypothetical protein
LSHTLLMLDIVALYYIIRVATQRKYTMAFVYIVKLVTQQ